MLKKYTILLAVCLGTVLSAYVSSCVNIALPNIMAALNFNMDSVVWVSLGYMLPYGSILPVTGKLGDLFGAKKVYIIGLLLFTVSSLLCGMTTTSTAMIVFRIIQGVGAGMLLPNAMAVVAETFAPHERGQALGLWSAMAAAGSALGPTLGGVIIESFDWRFVFFSVGPVCAISIILAFMIIPNSPQKDKVAIDYPGAILLIASLSSLLVALNQGQKEGWDSFYIVTMFYLAAATFILFMMIEAKTENPMIDVRLFRSRNFSIANIVGFLSFIALYGNSFMLPFFLKSYLGYNSTTAGLMLLPMSGTMVIFSPLGGKLADRLGSRIPTVAGLILIAGGLYSFHNISLQYSHADFYIRLTVFGMGLGLTMSPLTNCAVSTLPKDKMGVGSGIFNLAKIIGGSIGVVFAETLLARREIYHTQVLQEYLSAMSHSQEEITHLFQKLWGNQGMTGAEISTAVHGWLTGRGLLPEQYTMVKALLSSMAARQSAVLSFQDVFFTLSVLCFLGGVVALFIQRKVVKKRILEEG